jgi:hypothetical protein
MEGNPGTSRRRTNLAGHPPRAGCDRTSRTYRSSAGILVCPLLSPRVPNFTSRLGGEKAGAVRIVVNVFAVIGAQGYEQNPYNDTVL